MTTRRCLFSIVRVPALSSQSVASSAGATASFSNTPMPSGGIATPLAIRRGDSDGFTATAAFAIVPFGSAATTRPSAALCSALPRLIGIAQLALGVLVDLGDR